MATSNVEDLAPAAFSNNADWDESFDLSGQGYGSIVGTRAFMQLRPNAEALSVLADLSSPSDGIELRPLEKVLVIRIPLRRMQMIPPGSYVRDIVLRNRTGAVIFCGRGDVEIVAGVTLLKDNPPWQA